MFPACCSIRSRRRRTIEVRNSRFLGDQPRSIAALVAAEPKWRAGPTTTIRRGRPIAAAGSPCSRRELGAASTSNSRAREAALEGPSCSDAIFCLARRRPGSPPPVPPTPTRSDCSSRIFGRRWGSKATSSPGWRRTAARTARLLGRALRPLPGAPLLQRSLDPRRQARVPDDAARGIRPARGSRATPMSGTISTSASASRSPRRARWGA